MKIHETAIPGVLKIEPDTHPDARGSFSQLYRADEFRHSGIEPMVQMNLSRSHPGVLRGLHFQLTQPQAKLVTVVCGRVLDVAVDLRRGSPTFREYVTIELSAKNGFMVYLPRGIAHGFYSHDDSTFLYACDNFYAPEDQRGIVWNDRWLKVQWPSDHPIISHKDRLLPKLKDVADIDLPRYEP